MSPLYLRDLKDSDRDMIESPKKNLIVSNNNSYMSYKSYKDYSIKEKSKDNDEKNLKKNSNSNKI